jgi:hypothetical protein
LSPKFAVIAAVCALLLTTPIRAESAETSHLEFVKLYIEQLGAIERIRDDAAKELLADDATQRIADCVRTMTKYQLELSTQIALMQQVHMNKPFDGLAENLTEFEKQKGDLYKQMGDGCTTMMEGPKPNVDYGKLAASMPKINAQIDFIDQGIFKATPAVFATLIQMKSNSHGGADHLIITKAERSELIGRIRTSFGDKLNQHDQNYIVSAASVLEFYLTKKGYKASDEPWD